MEFDLENPLSIPINATRSLFNIDSDQNPSQSKDLIPNLEIKTLSLISQFSCNFDCSVSSTEFDLENPLSTTITTIQSLLSIESDKNPSQYRDLNTDLRRETVSLIMLFSRSFDYSVSYLAISYLDRFLFTQSIPMGYPWAARLMAISCVSLALKMITKTECSVSDIQHDGGFKFDTKAISRMEKLILGALKWRMRSITPFSFVNFFIALFRFKDPRLVLALKARAIEIIFKAQHDVKMLEFKPSVISATALLCASHELFPLQFPCFEEAISTCEYVNKNKLNVCYKMMVEIAMDGYGPLLGGAIISSIKTPINVLDLHYHSTTRSLCSDNEEDAITAVIRRPQRKCRKLRASEQTNQQC